MEIRMPAGAGYIIDELTSHGYEAYIVGGCVRDSILGKKPNDWDITTSATPEEVKRIFHRTIDTGIQHGTVTILVDKKYSAMDASFYGQEVMHTDYAYEVTTYRVDGTYEDHRRPKEVTFTASLAEDLKRRDFTINAMAYNDSQGIVDLFGGREDLENGIVRCVGNAYERFDEDALRILRAVRFAAQLGFSIEDKTECAMKKQARFLKDISAERIQVELTKLIISNHPELLVKAYELGLTAVFLPEFDAMMQTGQNNPYHIYSVGLHTIEVMKNVPANMIMRYAALLHDVGKPVTKTTDEAGVDHFYGHQDKGADMAKVILRRLKLDNHTIDSVCRLVKNHDYGIGGGVGIKAFRRFLGKLGKDNYNDYMTIRRADMAGQSEYRREEKLKAIADMEAMYDRVESEAQCISIAELAVDGKQLIACGMKPGRELGVMLHELLERVLDEPSLNTKEQLLKIVSDKLNNK